MTTVIDFLVTYGTPFVLGVLLVEILLELGDLREYKREREERDRQLPDRPIPMEHEHDN